MYICLTWNIQNVHIYGKGEFLWIQESKFRGKVTENMYFLHINSAFFQHNTSMMSLLDMNEMPSRRMKNDV